MNSMNEEMTRRFVDALLAKGEQYVQEAEERIATLKETLADEERDLVILIENLAQLKAKTAGVGEPREEADESDDKKQDEENEDSDGSEEDTTPGMRKRSNSC
ncbi:hypothetical protein L596_000947 [Steinernema carpocapsae]|uniref:Uncharacterized protein n=1 Tax=Steinernema carpocapsae TaxID=34508 RepID=A0A4U8UKW2_STECR|nr:hypothetical protein L596_000947 [Steinernema carpocapsae]